MVNAARKEKGGALTEFVITLPFVLVLVVGGVDFGRVTYERAALGSAAYAGAQYAAQSTAASQDLSAIRAAVLDDLGDDMDSDLVSTNTTRACMCAGASAVDCDTGTCTGSTTPQMTVTVSVQKDFQTLFTYPGLPSLVTLRRDAAVRAR